MDESDGLIEKQMEREMLNNELPLQSEVSHTNRKIGEFLPTRVCCREDGFLSYLIVKMSKFALG